LGAVLDEATARAADREAVVFHDAGVVTRWSYDDLLRTARAVAAALLAHGLQKGGRVALLMGNRPEWVASAFGVALAGGVLVPVNTYFEPAELEHVLRHSDCAVLLVQDRLLAHTYLAQLQTICPEIASHPVGQLRSPALPFLRLVVGLGVDGQRGAVLPWETFLASGADLSDEVLEACVSGIVPADDAVVIYTSGTTARPKGVLHAHRSPAVQSWRFARLLGLDDTVRVWSAFPFFWTAGFCMVMGATLAAGGCLVLQQHFEPGEALRLLEVERITSPHAWPHQLAELESHPDWERRDLSALRHVDAFTSFGRHPSVDVEDVWSSRAAYGLTETFTIVSSTPASGPPETREGHQGPILPGNAVRILDPATGEALAPDQQGEIAVKGPTLMKGYVKELPEDVFAADGFFRTGDAGFVDHQGRLHWTGRASGLIRTGGANVSPVEVEEALLRHPGLKVALIVGVPDAALGEMVVACVVAHDGAGVDEEDVRGFLHGRVASYKIPRRVLFFAREDLSLTGNAKVRADALRDLAVTRLG